MSTTVPPRSSTTRAERVFSRPAWIAAGIVAAAAFLYRYLSFVDFTNDHFVHLAMAQQVTMGAWPVRDFVERGLPLMTLVSAAAQAVFGAGLQSELMVVAGGFALAAGGTVLCAFAASRSLVIAIGLATASVLVFPASYSYPKLLLYAAALVVGVIYSARATWTWAAALGATVGLAFLFRHDHGVIIGAGVPVLVFARDGVTGRAVRAVLAAGAACAIVIAPYLFWVQRHEGLATYFRDGMLFSAREAERGTWGELPRFGFDPTKPMISRLGSGPIVNVRWQPGLPDPIIRRGERQHDLTRRDPRGPLSWQYEMHSWSSRAIERLVRDPLVADTDGIDRSAFRLRNPPPFTDQWLVRVFVTDEGLEPRKNGLAVIYYLVWLAPAAALVMVIGTWRRGAPAIRAWILMAIALQLLMDVMMLRDPLDTRVRDVVVPAFTLVAFLLGSAWNMRANLVVRAVARVVMSAVVVFIMIACGSLGEASTRLERIDARHGVSGAMRRRQQLADQLASPRERRGRLSPAYDALADYIASCTAPSSRVLALTFAPELLFYSGRGFAGGQVTLTPGYFATPRHAQLMLDRLSREDVPLVVMDSETEMEMAQGYPRVIGRVREQYDEVWRVRIAGSKDFVVLGDRERAIVGRYGAQQLPCYAQPGSSAR